MSSVPGFCPHCGCIFQSQVLGLQFVHNVTIDVRVNCPNCGEKANLVQGTFNEAGRGLEIVSAPPLTHAVFEILRDIAAKAEAGEISADQAFEQIESVAPRFATYLRFLADKGVPVIGLIVALVALYLQFADIQSSDAFEAEALKLMHQQTEIMEIIKNRADMVYGDRVYDERATPSQPKPAPNSFFSEENFHNHTFPDLPLFGPAPAAKPKPFLNRHDRRKAAKLDRTSRKQ